MIAGEHDHLFNTEFFEGGEGGFRLRAFDLAEEARKVVVPLVIHGEVKGQLSGLEVNAVRVVVLITLFVAHVEVTLFIDMTFSKVTFENCEIMEACSVVIELSIILKTLQHHERCSTD